MSADAYGTPQSPLLAALMGRTGGGPVLPANSRYQGVGTKVLTAGDGHEIVYLARRLVPAPDRFATLQLHRVGDGERLDQIAATLLGDPLLAWRVADANNALDPAELERRGRELRITLPEGIPNNA